jgi:hypothetical protein
MKSLKKIQLQKKLKLGREAIRILVTDDLRMAIGGGRDEPCCQSGSCSEHGINCPSSPPE